MTLSYYEAEHLIFCHFLVMTHLVKLWNAFSLAFIRSPNYVPIVLIYELLHQRQYKQLFKWRKDLKGLTFFTFSSLFNLQPQHLQYVFLNDGVSKRTSLIGWNIFAPLVKQGCFDGRTGDPLIWEKFFSKYVFLFYDYEYTW